ncbi:MAG: MTAP family purine nucleoside phosphorylase [Armatimonadota bacterium]|nr:MTAP family purine nucleoside phosphorylase [Armatimonadota bacterium]
MPINEVGNGFALIGGSMGFKTLQSPGANIRELGRVETPFGSSQPLYLLVDNGLIYMSRHGIHGYEVSAPFVNYRANIWALKELGVERIIAWSGPASMDELLDIGEIVVPADVIDETKARKYTFYENLGLGFIRQNPAFCPCISEALVQVCVERFGRCASDRVYVCTEGPRLETVAEIRKYKMFGGNLVGMTLVPEAFLAKELEMCYAPLCYITNYAEGVRTREFRPGVLFEGLLDDNERHAVDAAVAALPEIAVAAMELLSNKPRDCKCGKSMERYRRRGDIGDDWRTWITVGEK